MNALNSNTTGTSNTANGVSALFSNNTGPFNTANGAEAFFSNTIGTSNTANGYRALFYNTTGGYNTASGADALRANTIGNENTANGYQALFFNTSGNYNTANGLSALFSNTSGSSNTANGYGSLYYNNSGNYNTASGLDALRANTTGFRNTAMRYSSGSFNNANSYCSFFGYDADQSVSTDFTNSMALGNSSRITASNQVRIGNTGTTSIGGYTGWTTLSPPPGAYTKNAKENIPGLKFINLLKPVTYTLDANAVSRFLSEDIGASEKRMSADGKPVEYEKDEQPEALKQQSREARSKIINTGFIAQEVEEAAKKIGYDFSGVDKPQNEHSFYGLRYTDFVVPLVKAVQELSAMNGEKDEKINALEARLEKLEALLANQSSVSSSAGASANAMVSGASLEQNIPNPFTNTTAIRYTFPQKFTNAQIVITGKSGNILKQIRLSGAGKGVVQIDASTLSSGAYNYSLYVEGKLISTKQMIIAK